MVKVKKVVKGSPELLKALDTLLNLPPTPEKPRKTGYFLEDEKFWSLTRDGITQSIIQLFALCPRKAFYKMVEGIEVKGKDHALDFGTFFHEALDECYSHIMKANLVDLPSKVTTTIIGQLYNKTLKRLIDDRTDINDMQQFEVCYGLCVILLGKYFERWNKEDERLTWIDIERVFSFPYKLRDGTVIQIKGKFDGVFRDQKGKLWLFETKTKSQIAGNYIMEKINFDLQVMIYQLAIQHVYGEQPAGVLYNLVKRPGQKYTGTFNRKSEGIPQFLMRVDADIVSKPNEYFIRYKIPIQPGDIEQYKLQDLDYIIERIYEWSQGGYSSFRNSGACSMWNRPCEYLPICSNNDRSRFSQRSAVFPELEVVE